MGEAADVGAGRLAGPLPPDTEPSLAVGYPNLLALLERRGVRATFFVEGWNGAYHPEAVAELLRRGHEVGMHGWAHERWSELGPETEARLARRATEALRAAGADPVGFRAPGGARTASTERILLELGYRYDASLAGPGRDDEPRPGPGRLPAALTQVPFTWAGVDGAYYLRREPVAPELVRDAWLVALNAVVERGGVFVLVCHAFLTGMDRGRLAALEALIEAAQRDPRVTVRTAGEVAASIP